MRSRLTIGLLLGTVMAGAQTQPWQLDTELTWHDNVTNGEREIDRLPALEWQTELQTGIMRVLPDGHRLSMSAGIRLALWARYEGLNLVAPEIAGAWEYKPGFGPHRPLFRAEIEGEGVMANESDRGGWGGAGRLQLQQRAGTDWLFTAGHEWRRFDARSHAFDSTGREWFGRVRWTLGAHWSVVAEGRRRQGTVISYSEPPRPDLVKIGKPLTFVDTFEQSTPWLAYYFPAETRSGALELQRAFGRAGVSLRHEYRHTLHAGPGYRNHRTTLRYTMSF